MEKVILLNPLGCTRCRCCHPHLAMVTRRLRKVKGLVQSHAARKQQRRACSRDPAGSEAGALLATHPAAPGLCAGRRVLRRPSPSTPPPDTHTCKPRACNVNPKPEPEGWDAGGLDGYTHQYTEPCPQRRFRPLGGGSEGTWLKPVPSGAWGQH